MSILLIKQNDQFIGSELDQLNNLIAACQVRDNVVPKIYQDLLSSKRAFAGNFLGYHEQNLVAYLSCFWFDDDAVTICALVHPDFRRQGCFTLLLQAAQLEIKKLGIHKAIFYFPAQNAMAKHCLSKLGAQFSYADYSMQRFSKVLEKNDDHRLAIRIADQQDVELITALDVNGFDSDYATMLQRFNDTISDSRRIIWLASVENTYVGKAHVLFENDEAIIHDVCINTVWRNRGYGRLLLQNIINELIEKFSCYQITLEVTTTNICALKLYEYCSFKISNVTEYWSLNLQ